MQTADSERTPKRPRYDGSPSTQPNTPPAAAARSPSPELHPDSKTWGPEEVCLFLRHNDFSDSGVLDRFRGSKGWGAAGRPPEAGAAGLTEGALGQGAGGLKEDPKRRTREAPEGVDLQGVGGRPRREDLRPRALLSRGSEAGKCPLTWEAPEVVDLRRGRPGPIPEMEEGGMGRLGLGTLRKEADFGACGPGWGSRTKSGGFLRELAAPAGQVHLFR